MIVTFAIIKGGCGKTTGAMHLARAITLAGGTAAVADADRQGSALRWSKQARAAGEQLPFAVRTAATIMLPDIIDELAEEVDDIVIDTGPGDAEIAAQAIALSDLVVIPINPREDDLAQARTTIAQCTELEIPYGVLFSRIRPSESAASDFRSELGAEDPPKAVFDTEITELVRIGFAFGSRIDDVTPYDQLLKEIRQVVR